MLGIRLFDTHVLTNVTPHCVTILLIPAVFKAKRLFYLNARTVKECNATFLSLVKHRIVAH